MSVHAVVEAVAVVNACREDEHVALGYVDANVSVSLEFCSVKK